MTEDKQRQIDCLASIKVRIAPSRIHGVGVFAMFDIVKGEKLNTDLVPQVFTLTYSDLKKLHPDIQDLLLGQWPNIVNGSRFAYPTARIQAYVNHSHNPNYDAHDDIVLENIAAGKEITEDYREIQGHEQIFPWLVDR